ncbi:MAG: amidase family protein [Candidatus Heimdallarchaeota archaeon]
MGAEDKEKSKIAEWRELARSNEIDIEEYYQNLIEQLSRTNKEFHAFHTIQAYSDIASDLGKNTTNPLMNFPYSAKDNICTKGIETTAGSRILEGYIPPFNATVVERVTGEGGVLLGKTNMDEFGFGTFATNSGFEIPRNPYNKELVSGGSSGGAGVATAIMEFHFALAVSTGGSISCPAAFNGIVGFTPSYGVVSRWGLIDYANSLDKIGLMARYTRDIEIIFSKIAGKDGKDSTLANYQKAAPTKNENPKNLKIGVFEEALEHCEETVTRSFGIALDRLSSEYSLEYERVEVPSVKHAIAAYYLISTAEASTNLARYCGMRFGKQLGIYERHFDMFFTEHRTKFFGEEAKRRIILGTFARMAGYRDRYFSRALKIRELMISEYKQLLKQYDVIATPTMPILPPNIEKARKMSPIETYSLDILTIPPNLCGLPHISLPSSYEPAPSGIQFIADHYNEPVLFCIGKLWENIFSYKEPETKIGVVK